MVFDYKCARRRKVRGCDHCCRYENCRDETRPEFPNYDGCLRLGYAIIGNVAEEYTKAYRRGKKNTCQHLASWFRTQETAILSAETYDGQAIIDALERKCKREYGDINDIWCAKEKTARKKISALKQELEKTENIKTKQKIMAKISAIRGELNE